MKKSLIAPLSLILLLTGLCLVAAYFVQDFRFDASEDTLVAEGDPELAYYRDVSEQFGGEGFLVLTFTPTNQPLISPESIQNIQQLVAQLEEIDGVSNVDSMLEAPLLQSPHVPVSELATGFRTLLSDDVDLSLARKELTQSPLFRNLLISEDGQTTAIRIQLEPDQALAEIREQRRELRTIENPTEQQQQQLTSVEERYQKIYSQHLQDREHLISQIRAVRDNISDDVKAYLGGIPMIAADMISFVKQDVVIFGSIVIALISAMLFWLFRQLRWVLYPLASTGVTIFLTTGILGFLQQPTTVVSSNYISLLTIFSISFAIHLIVRYRELGSKHPDMRHQALVIETMKDKLAPCVYMALTTMVAFGSLVTSDIVPVMDFGWIMSIGILVSFLVTYALFAGILLLLPRAGDHARLHDEPRITHFLSGLAVNRTRLVLVLMLIVFVVAALGIGRLSMDNRFVEYFRDHTEIHKGLEFIDKNLGGTMPMDIILQFPPYEEPEEEEASFFSTGAEDSNARLYWFTPNKIQYLREMHNYLERKEAVGKIISLENLEQVAQTYNDGEPLGPVELVTAIKAMPERVYHDLIEPYASPDTGMMRITLRLHETVPDYTIEELIEDIEHHAVNELGFAAEDVRITGMAVLFNGMLQHLFDSQTSTLVFVILATLIMFMLLLRSLTLAVLGLIPNVLAAATALGLMGYLGIPLDVMTITIAAIIIGIGVDDAIHYLHRFRKEYAASHNVRTAVSQSHQSIGNAIYYTSVTVIIGFSVLVFSNFVPSVYFGLMTALAMLLALTANLTILPGLLILAYQSKDKQRTQANEN